MYQTDHTAQDDMLAAQDDMLGCTGAYQYIDPSIKGKALVDQPFPLEW